MPSCSNRSSGLQKRDLCHQMPNDIQMAKGIQQPDSSPTWTER